MSLNNALLVLGALPAIASLYCLGCGGLVYLYACEGIYARSREHEREPERREGAKVMRLGLLLMIPALALIIAAFVIPGPHP